MKLVLRLLCLFFVFVSCNTKSEKCEHPSSVTFNEFFVTKDGDTINRTTENGKQGLWTYTKADGSQTDTVYKNGYSVRGESKN